MDINRLLDALRHVESRGNRFAVSPKGARGPYQFMPKTAREYGLQGNDVYDEQKSRAAAHKKISGLISRYGLERGIAAYNMGEGNLEKVGGDYSKFPETAKYVPSVLAAYKGSQGDLKNAGFKGYQQRPQANIDNFPITPIQGVEPQSKVVEAKNMPVVNNLVDFAKEQKGIKHSKLMAQALAGAFDGYDPNAMVSGRVVEMHPITALAKALQTGFGAYEGSRAIDKESDLEAKKASVLQDMMNSGAPIDQNSLLSSGLVPPEKIAEALVAKQQQAEYNAVYGDNGEIMAFDKSNGKVTPTGKKSALYAPDSVFNRSLASSAGKGVEMTDDKGRPYYVPQGQTNPSFGSYGQNPPSPTRLDQPTGLMPVPNSAPLPIPNSAPIVKGASPIDLKRQEAEALQPIKQQEESFKTDEELRKAKGLIPIKAEEQKIAPKPMTESQAKATTFASQMQSASNEIDKIEAAGFKPDSLSNQAKVGLAGGITNILADADAQKYKQAQNQWAESFLRVKTGAAATKDEIEMNRKTFFPQIGDDEETVKQKALMRRQAEMDTLNMSGLGKDLATPRQINDGDATKSPKIIRYDAQGNRVQ